VAFGEHRMMFRPRDSYDYDRAYRSNRAATPTQNSRKPVLVVAAVGVVVVLFAILVFNSHAGDSPAQPIRPAPVNLALTPAETRSETPIEQASATESGQPLAESAPTAEITAAEPPPLMAANLVPPSALLPSLEPSNLDSLFFDVGSSRAAVIAAQGLPPTYAAHHDRTLWWGSSRVEFDQDSKVRSWVDGTPALNVYRR